MTSCTIPGPTPGASGIGLRVFPEALVRWALVAGLTGAGIAGHAQEVASPAARDRLIEERSQRIQEIDRERARIREQQAAESQQCYQRFVVNSCVQEVADRHRKSLTALRREETAINNAEREREGREQRARIVAQEQADREDRARASARGAGAPTADQRQQAAQDKLRQQEAQQPARSQQGAARQQRKEIERSEALRQRAQQADEAPASADRFEAKQREAQARREERDRRLQERAAKAAAGGKPAPQALPSRSGGTVAP